MLYSEDESSECPPGYWLSQIQAGFWFLSIDPYKFQHAVCISIAWTNFKISSQQNKEKFLYGHMSWNELFLSDTENYVKI